MGGNRINEILFSKRKGEFIKEWCKNNQMFFYFDSCAHYSIVPAKYFPEATGQALDFSWINPKVLIKSQGIVKLRLRFENRPEMVWDFHALQGIDIALIGIDFMNEFGVQLCLKTGRVKFTGLQPKGADEPIHSLATEGLNSTLTVVGTGVLDSDLEVYEQPPSRACKMTQERPTLNDLESADEEGKSEIVKLTH